MIKESQRELVVEILDQDQDWGRSDFIHLAQVEGRNLRILSLGDSRPPLDDSAGLWLDLKAHAEIANDSIREFFPRFLHETARATGLLDITVLDEMVSLYWFMPISEMSSLRNPLINKIYSLFVLRSVLKDVSFEQITLVVDDPLLEKPLRQIAFQMGVEHIESLPINSKTLPYYKNRSTLVVNWWRSFIRDLAYWFILHLPGLRQLPQSGEDMLGLTFFPTLWLQDENGQMQNRAFGDWPEELAKHGHGFFYLALPTMKPSDLLYLLKHWRAMMPRSRMIFMHSLVQLGEVFRVYLRMGWGNKIEQWFQTMNHKPCLIDGIDVTELLHREYLHEIWEQTIPQSMLLARAAQSITELAGNLVGAVHAFEFQPIEKAFVLGVKLAKPHMPVIGLQTAIIGKNHLGYRFLVEQLHKDNEIKPPFAPLPDYFAAYGTVAYTMLKKLLGQERAILTGPIRYPYLKVDSDQERRAAESDLKQRLNLKPGVVPVLLALTSLRPESDAIMKSALDIGRDNPEIYFIVRFHYWVDLNDELKAYAARIGFDRFQVDGGDLHGQLMACRLMITGTSSIAIEAMVSGCMPVVCQLTGTYDLGPISDVAEGAFFYSNEKELGFAVQQGLRRGREYQLRQACWPGLLERHCYRLDGRSSTRLYDWLVTRGVFKPV